MVYLNNKTLCTDFFVAIVWTYFWAMLTWISNMFYISNKNHVLNFNNEWFSKQLGGALGGGSGTLCSSLIFLVPNSSIRQWKYKVSGRNTKKHLKGALKRFHCLEWKYYEKKWPRILLTADFDSLVVDVQCFIKWSSSRY